MCVSVTFHSLGFFFFFEAEKEKASAVSRRSGESCLNKPGVVAMSLIPALGRQRQAVPGQPGLRREPRPQQNNTTHKEHRLPMALGWGVMSLELRPTRAQLRSNSTPIPMFSVVGGHLSPDCHLAATTPKATAQTYNTDLGRAMVPVVPSSGLLCALERRTPFLF